MDLFGGADDVLEAIDPELAFIGISCEQHEGTIASFDAKWKTECLGTNREDGLLVVQEEAFVDVPKSNHATCHIRMLFHYRKFGAAIVDYGESFQKPYTLPEVRSLSHLLDIATNSVILKLGEAELAVLPPFQS